jgi:hypothetical protein
MDNQKPDVGKQETDQVAIDDTNAVQKDQKDSSNANKRMTLKSFFWSWRLIVVILIFVLAIGGPISWVTWIQPMIATNTAKEIGSTTVVSYQHSWKKGTLDKTLVDDLNINESQYSLVYKDQGLTTNKSIGRSGDTSCLVFKGDGRTPNHHVKLVLSFGDDKSRNLLSEQATQLAYGMKKGTISVETCFLLSDTEYSALALEALGEIDFNDPSYTWQALQSLAQVDTSSFSNTNDMVKAILKIVSSLKNSGFQEGTKSTISEKSLKTGSFIQWARVMTNANTVKTIPAFFLDGDNLSNISDFKMYNPDALYQKIEALK